MKKDADRQNATRGSLCSQVCAVLDEGGIPPDIKWRGTVGFLREVADIPIFSAKQKKMFHALLKKLVAKKDFSQTAFLNFISKIQDIYNIHINEELIAVKQQLKQKEQELKEERKHLQEMITAYTALIEYGQAGIKDKITDVDNIKTSTIKAVNQYEDKSKIISEVTRTANLVMNKMVKEAAHWRQKAQEADEWRTKAQLMEQIAAIDKLTQVYTRRLFDEQVLELISQAMTSQKDVSLIMLDIDHFKKINDTYGHQAGDEVLRIVTGLIKQVAFGMSGVPYRYGGEEFAILFEGLKKDETASIAEGIRKAIEEHKFTITKASDNSTVEIKITISAGVAELADCLRLDAEDIKVSEDEEHPELYKNKIKFINAADFALYQAKSAGRNRVVVF